MHAYLVLSLGLMELMDARMPCMHAMDTPPLTREWVTSALCHVTRHMHVMHTPFTHQSHAPPILAWTVDGMWHGPLMTPHVAHCVHATPRKVIAYGISRGRASLDTSSKKRGLRGRVTFRMR
jgi:hypothetical protein